MAVGLCCAATHGRASCQHQSRSSRKLRPLPAASPNRLSPSPSDPPVALAECAHGLRDADERPDDLQRPSAPLLGAVWANFDHPWLTFSGRPIPRLGDDPLDLQSRRRRGAGISLSPGCWSCRSCCSWRPASSTAMRSATSSRRATSSSPAISGATSASMRGCASPPGRRRALQHPAEAQLSRGDLRPAAADGPHRAHHVAGDGRGLAVAARRLRRAAVGALDPLHRRRRSSPSSWSTW